MHKVHKIYKYTIHRRDVVVVGVSMVAIVEGYSCMNKEESAAVELKKGGTVQ
jgi:hypothetical protein